MNHLVGYTIILLSVVLTAAAVAWRWVQWRRYAPKDTYRGVGIIYKEGAIRPWPGLESAIDALADAAQLDPRIMKARSNPIDFWIEVVPYMGVCSTPYCITGFTTLDNKEIFPPVTAEEAKNTRKLTGSFRTDRFLPITKKHFIAVVRQLRAGDDRIPDALGIGAGALKPATSSALWHEYAQHLVPFWLFQDLNANHARKDMDEFEATIKAAWKRRVKPQA